MGIYVSYFYQIRNMGPCQIPISIAQSDPKWFHGGASHIDGEFIDKNGVINGIRYEYFTPNVIAGHNCALAIGDECNRDMKCEYMQNYYEQLSELPMPAILNALKECSEMFAKRLQVAAEDIDLIFIVHEAPDNPCSERFVLRKYFEDNGVPLKEWSVNEKKSEV